MRIVIGAAVATLLAAAAAGAAVAWHPPQAATKPAPRPSVPAEIAVPGLTWQSGAATLRLLEHPCPYKDVALQLETEGIAPALSYVVHVGQKRIIGCWARDMGGDVMTLEPGRELGQIPLAWFRADRVGRAD